LKHLTEDSLTSFLLRVHFKQIHKNGSQLVYIKSDKENARLMAVCISKQSFKIEIRKVKGLGKNN
jgi:hypothetical protein